MNLPGYLHCVAPRLSETTCECSKLKCAPIPIDSFSSSALKRNVVRCGRMLNRFCFLRTVVTVGLSWGLILNSFAQVSRDSNGSKRESNPRQDIETVVLPESVPDPLERVNRVFWEFNKGVMMGVVKPTAKVYRFIVRKPVRTRIGNFGKNITYPGRLINNLLQGKWSGARDETYRFLCNTTVGLAGIHDVATKWKIPKSEADFGQTFGQWGWKPQCYLMLPIFGPSNERDALGHVTDTAANPLTYLTPYRFRASEPVTYVSPYTYYSHAVMYNNLTDTVDEYARFSESEMDAYSKLQYAWTFVRENRVADFQVKGEQDEASLETLQSVFFTFKDPEFPNHGKTQSVLIPATGKKLKFTFWLQPGKAPVVYIIPGLGSHRLAETASALAELVYDNGFSAVCVSSPYNYEFMEHASAAALPAYTPVDAHDLHAALTQIDQQLGARYSTRLGSRALMGYSMGAFQSLFIASTQSTNQAPLVKFDRYVGIHPPVRLLYGVSKLDEFYNAPLTWSSGQRTTNIENTFLKVAALSKNSLMPQPSLSLPFDAVESKFLIGLVFRYALRDVIFSSQQRNNQGVLEHRIKRFKRDPVYREILRYSYKDYFEKFLTPYYQTRGIDLSAPDVLEKANDLRTYAAGLQANPNIRLIVNRNDFLLPDEDMEWLRTIFPPGQLKIFEQGGHLGNLSNTNVQKAILGGLEDLKPTQQKSKPKSTKESQRGIGGIPRVPAR
jgi:ABC-type transporter lipoprotein component MlaA/pimeloyl-ACP methyl ester carboxylesterase